MQNKQHGTHPVRQLNRKAIRLCLLGILGLFGLVVVFIPSSRSQSKDNEQTPPNQSNTAVDRNIPGFLKNLPDAYPAAPRFQEPPAVVPALPVEAKRKSKSQRSQKKSKANIQAVKVKQTGLFFPGASRFMGHSPGASFANTNHAQRKQTKKTKQPQRAATQPLVRTQQHPSFQINPFGQQQTIPMPESLPAHLVPLANENTVHGNRDPNGHVQKHLFLGEKDNSIRILQPSPGKYAIMEGSFLPAVLETHINSDLPGPIKARIKENVYDTKTGQHLLIPQGSTLIGEYNSVVGHTQQRAQVVWSRLILPNTRSVNLMRMPAVDARGSSGKKAKVNNHYNKLMSSILITSLMTAGASHMANKVGGKETFAQNLGNNLNDYIQQAGQQIVQRNLASQPTLEVEQGAPLQVFATADLLLVPYEY